MTTSRRSALTEKSSLSTNNVSYRFEPNYEKNGYDIWRYPDGFKTGGGEVIAYASTPEEALSAKCFDGKSFAEIENEATHKFII